MACCGGKRASAGLTAPATGQELPWLYVVLPALVVSNLLVLSLLDFLRLPNWMEDTFRGLIKQPALAFFMLCVAAPVLEELLFRGILLKGLLRNYRPWVAIGQSALLFGLIHMNPVQIVGAGLIGLLLGWLYYRTQSLRLCMAAHALNNFVAFLGMTNPSVRDVETAQALFGSTSAYALAVVASGLILGGILWRVQQVTTGTNPEVTLAMVGAPATVAAVETTVFSAQPGNGKADSASETIGEQSAKWNSKQPERN